MSRVSSQLRVFVQFKEDTIFAGEDVECTITFKNVEIERRATPKARPGSRNDPQIPHHTSNPLDRLKTEAGPSCLPARRSSTSARPQPALPQRNQGQHKHTSSFSIVESAGNADKTPELPGGGFHIASAGRKRNHGRNVSIVSLGGSSGQQRPAMKHGRSASVQVSSDGRPLHLRRPSLGSHRSHSLATSQLPPPLSPSPLSASSSNSLPLRSSHSRSPASDNRQRAPSQSSSRSVIEPIQRLGPKSFQFPPPPLDTSAGQVQVRDTQPSLTTVAPRRRASPRSHFSARPNGSVEVEQTASLATVSSLRSMEGTPRSSVDLYSESGHSDETLMSELPGQLNRLLPDLRLSRRSSLASRPPVTESILMGYAQLSGSFTLDGSLVNQTPFEEVKRNAVVGGQGGGGVVGVIRPAAESGLFGSFNWNSIGESLGGFIGAGGPSSMKEMKGIAGSNSIPLLSTSKSILFVDLNLAPGESRSYRHRFTLPRGLPPSHKGRAMKVSYNLVIGTHRPGSKRSQPQVVKSVQIPFRVLSGVTPQGEYLGHDLMSPYIILKDQAHTQSIAADTADHFERPERSSQHKNRSASTKEDFDEYVHKLLTRPRRDSTSGILSPTAEPTTPRTPRTPSKPPRRPPTPEASANALIDNAIRFCTNTSSPIYSPTNFTIARSSIPIASVTLSRPALKMGETITCLIDFSNAKLPCYAFEATLASSERIDPALAIRSPQSVERATRRVWASTVENTIWTRRSVFRAQVPVIATPAFATSGVSLEWCVRFELVIGLPHRSQTPEGEESSEELFESMSRAERVLDISQTDDRGTVLVAKQHLPCDSFQVEIPIRVFGAVVGSVDDNADLEEGLPV